MYVSQPIRFFFALLTLFVAAAFAYLYYNNQAHWNNQAIDLSALQLGLMARLSYAWVVGTGFLLILDARSPNGGSLSGFLVGGINALIGLALLFTPLQWFGDFGAWAALPLMSLGAIGFALCSVTWGQQPHRA